MFLPNGITKWIDGRTQEERNLREIEIFREKYNKAYPPPEPGTFPIKVDDILVREGNRWQCIGGPMDPGEGIAKVLKLKKGRGKNQITVWVPINPETFTVSIGDKDYLYQFDESEGIYVYSEDSAF